MAPAKLLPDYLLNEQSDIEIGGLEEKNNGQA